MSSLQILSNRVQQQNSVTSSFSLVDMMNEVSEVNLSSIDPPGRNNSDWNLLKWRFLTLYIIIYLLEHIWQLWGFGQHVLSDEKHQCSWYALQCSVYVLQCSFYFLQRSFCFLQCMCCFLQCCFYFQHCICVPMVQPPYRKLHYWEELHCRKSESCTAGNKNCATGN